MNERDSTHLVLGYDAREMYLPASANWTTQRRREFLLRSNVDKPLSTDGLVWPSIFDTGEAPGLTPSERKSCGLDGLPLPVWIGPNRPLWEDIEALKWDALRADSGHRPFWLVAISLDGDNETERYSAPLARISHPPNWTFLGFDVADSGLLSGLSNCGYDPAELEEMRLTWEPSLNQFHLFNAFAAASAFRELTNKRVPEHAPFFVFGLWRIGGQVD